MTANGDPRARTEALGGPPGAPLRPVRVDWVHDHQLRRLLEQDDRQLARELGITGWS
ncbi:hypothetical protein [Nocardioides sp.]|uniref:hypothetical protein n=1 Tax=Nocardioides sp. TaxID=35761 RepID=UPI003D0E7939